MLIIGCDFHTRYQQIATAEEKTGELLLAGGQALARIERRGGLPFAVLVFARAGNPSPQLFHNSFEC